MIKEENDGHFRIALGVATICRGQGSSNCEDPQVYAPRLKTLPHHWSFAVVGWGCAPKYIYLLRSRRSDDPHHIPPLSFPPRPRIQEPEASSPRTRTLPRQSYTAHVRWTTHRNSLKESTRVTEGYLPHKKALSPLGP